MAFVAPVMGILSTGMQLVGGMMGAGAASAQAQYQAAVARNNAIIAEQNAQYAILVGESKAQTEGFKTAARVGKQKVTQAASGLDVGVGSPTEVRGSEAELGRMNALLIMNEAEQRLYNFRAQKSNFQAEAQLHEMKAKNAQTAGIFGGIGTLLGGATSLADKWQGYQRAGVFA